jgi:hypothetical protein
MFNPFTEMVQGQGHLQKKAQLVVDAPNYFYSLEAFCANGENGLRIQDGLNYKK